MNVSFNSAAREQLGTRSKIRVTARDGVLRFRPTDRKSAVNLTKGDKLIDITSGKATLPEGIEAGAGKYGLAGDKYGWMVLTPDAQGRGPTVTIG